MRIREISVSDLFGTFEHVIPLNLADRITIIHGPNGFGKTVVLKMLHAVFSQRWSIFHTTPFRTFRVTFGDDDYVEVSRVVNERPRSKRSRQKIGSPTITVVRGGASSKKVLLPGRDQKLTAAIDRYLSPYLTRIGPDHWTVDRTQELLNAEEVLERYKDRLPSTMKSGSPIEESWARDILSSMHLLFIKTQRLEEGARIVHDRFLPHRRPDSSTAMTQTSSVRRHSDDIAREIQTTLNIYAARSQELDSSFPIRLFAQKRGATLPLGELKQRLERLEAKRSELTTLGFLDSERDSHRRLPRITEEKREALSVFVLDNEKKLAVFDEMAHKTKLLTDIINRRFQYKQMSINKEHGFVFTSLVDGTDLAATGLSSGEQHEIVLLYELLFKVRPQSLILIDEPEISLHIAWQQQFVKDLQEIVRLSHFDVLVTTHSPAIIGRRLDLAVELKGPSLPKVNAKTKLVAE